jgi:hypothetical protein
MLFNSGISTYLQAKSYVVIPAMEDWVYGSQYNISGFLDIGVIEAITQS